MPLKKYKNPKGGLSKAGRDYYKRTQGSNLKPGVKNYSKASTANKKRWVRWALRFAGRSTIPPLKKPNGEPTRFALMFTAWGEPVPQSVESVRKVYKKAQARRDQLGMGKAAKKKINAEDKNFSMKKNELNFSSVKINVESGNPYRNPATGKFSFELPGVQTVVGGRYIKQINSDAKTAVANRISYTNANQIGLKKGLTGDLILVLANNGRIVDTFSVPSTEKETGEEINQSSSEGERGEEYQSPFSLKDKTLKDSILLASRNLNLNKDQVVAFIEEKIQRKLSDSEKYNIQEEIIRQRIEDLIQYLDYNLYKKINKKEPDGRVKIRTPRGYLRRTFAGFDKNQAEEVLNRLKAMGWDDTIIEENVATFMSRKLKRELGYQADEKN